MNSRPRYSTFAAFALIAALARPADAQVPADPIVRTLAEIPRPLYRCTIELWTGDVRYRVVGPGSAVLRERETPDTCTLRLRTIRYWTHIPGQGFAQGVWTTDTIKDIDCLPTTAAALGVETTGGTE